MTVMAAALSETLGPEQRVDEVEHEPRGHEAGERIVEDHGQASSEPIAGDRVADRQREEDDGGGHQDDVQHVNSPSDERISPYKQVRELDLDLTSRSRSLLRLSRRHYLSPIA